MPISSDSATIRVPRRWRQGSPELRVDKLRRLYDSSVVVEAAPPTRESRLQVLPGQSLEAISVTGSSRHRDSLDVA